MKKKIKMYEAEDGKLFTADEVYVMLHYALKIDILPGEKDFDKVVFKCSSILRIKNMSLWDIIKTGRIDLALNTYIELLNGTKCPYKIYEIRKFLRKINIYYLNDTDEKSLDV